jgi:CrcB protein
MPWHVLWVAIGGAAGAVARYQVSISVQQRWPHSFPWGTLVVNLVGCLAIGLLAQAYQSGWLNPTARLLLTTGFLGSLTTFSTFGYETIVCLQEHGPRLALANVAANLLLGLAAVAVGMWLGRLITA